MASEFQKHDIIVHQIQTPLTDQSDLFALDWELFLALPAFKRAEDGELASHQTVTRLCCTVDALYIRSSCVKMDCYLATLKHQNHSK